MLLTMTPRAGDIWSIFIILNNVLGPSVCSRHGCRRVHNRSSSTQQVERAERQSYSNRAAESGLDSSRAAESGLDSSRAAESGLDSSRAAESGLDSSRAAESGLDSSRAAESGLDSSRAAERYSLELFSRSNDVYQGNCSA